MNTLSFKRSISLLLLAALLCSMFSIPAFGDNSQFGDTYILPGRTPVPFSEMPTDTFDRAVIETAIDDMSYKMNIPDSLDDLKADWNVITDEFDLAATNANLLYIHYMLNSADSSAYAKYSEFENTLTEISDHLIVVIQALLASSYSEEMTAYINCDNLIHEVMNYRQKSSEEFALVQEQLSLIEAYYNLSGKNAEHDAAEIYLKLLDNMIAQAFYYDNYETFAEMSYDMVYFRDFKPEDTELLSQWAKDYAVVYMNKLQKLLYSMNISGFYSVRRTQDEMLAAVQPFLTSLSPLAEEAFNVMREYGLCDIGYSSVKNDGSFTTDLYAYGIPFIYSGSSSSGASTETLIHEFGHYYSSYANFKPALYQYSCYDTCEIDSQALELIMSYYADEIFGEGLFGTVLVYNIYSMFTAIIEGCLFDEFQTTALAMRMDGTLNTADDVINLYMDLEREYYGSTSSWGHNWYLVHHSFVQPFYYISYATSATAALGFLTLAADDLDNAIAAYNNLIALGNDYGFSATMEFLGMPDPLTADGLIELSDGLSVFIDKIIAAYSSESDNDVKSSIALPNGESSTADCTAYPYANYEAGLFVDMSADKWVIYDDNQIQEVFGISADMFSDSSINDYLESGQQLVEFMAVSDDGMSNINIVSQMIPAAMSGMSETDIVESSLQDTLDALSGGMTVLDYETGLYEVAGLDHGAIFIHSDLQGTDVYQLLIFVKSDNTLYQITATSFEEDTTDEILAAIVSPSAASETYTVSVSDSISSDAYININAGITISLDSDSWTIYDNAQIREVFGVSAEMFNDDSLAEYMESGQQLIEYMAVAADGNSNINVVSQYIPLNMLNYTESEIVDFSLQDTLDALSGGMTVLDYETGLYEVAGLDHGAMFIHSDFQGTDVYQLLIFIKSDSTLYQLTATSFYEDLTDTIFDAVTAA